MAELCAKIGDRVRWAGYPRDPHKIGTVTDINGPRVQVKWDTDMRAGPGFWVQKALLEDYEDAPAQVGGTDTSFDDPRKDSHD